MRKNNLSQTMIEYSILIGIVTFSLIAMNIYLKRSFQGKYRQTADSLSQQYSPGRTQGNTTIFTESFSRECSGNITCQDLVGHSLEGGTISISNTTQSITTNETVLGGGA